MIILIKILKSCCTKRRRVKTRLLVLIESNCQDAVNLINAEEEEENHPCCTLTEDCKNLKREKEPEIQHVLREANWRADKMANSKRETCENTSAFNRACG